MRCWFSKSFWHVTRLVALAALIAFVVGVAHSGRRQLSVEVLWPKGTPQGILVFLHGSSRDPWRDERKGINALSSFAARRGYVTVVPLAERRCGPCMLLRCWSLDDLDDEIEAIDEVVRGLDRRPLERRIIGFSSGGFFVGAALERDLLHDYARVGIIHSAVTAECGVISSRELTAERAQRFMRWFWALAPSTAPTPTTAMCP